MIDLKVLTQYHVIGFEVTVYSEKSVWITGKQTVSKKYPDGSLQFSHIKHNLKGTTLDEVFNDLVERAKVFHNTFHEIE